MDGWMDGWMDEGMDGGMDGQLDGRIEEVTIMPISTVAGLVYLTTRHVTAIRIMRLYDMPISQRSNQIRVYHA
eukprot:scaffold29609_cov17-Prasinocladus_malaysianus.AAC.1